MTCPACNSPLREDSEFRAQALACGLDRHRFVCACGRSHYWPLPTLEAPRAIQEGHHKGPRVDRLAAEFIILCACGCCSFSAVSKNRRYYGSARWCSGGEEDVDGETDLPDAARLQGRTRA